MKRKNILVLTLAACLGASTLLSGCGQEDTKDKVENSASDASDNIKEDAKDIGEGVKEGTKDIGEGIKEGTESLVDKIQDKTMTYSEDDFKKALEEKNLKVEEVKNEKSYFNRDSDDYTINGQTISVYEYDEKDDKGLNDDLSKITNNGKTIDGKDYNWNAEPHIYKKGRIVVVYDGNDGETLNTLNDILGAPILG